NNRFGFSIFLQACLFGKGDSAIRKTEVGMRRKLVERELTCEGPRRSGGSGRKVRSVAVNLGESPLGWLYAHGHLDERLFDAGERLRRDYELAQLSSAVTMRWDAVRIRNDSYSGPDRLAPTER